MKGNAQDLVFLNTVRVKLNPPHLDLDTDVQKRGVLKQHQGDPKVDHNSSFLDKFWKNFSKIWLSKGEILNALQVTYVPKKK